MRNWNFRSIISYLVVLAALYLAYRFVGLYGITAVIGVGLVLFFTEPDSPALMFWVLVIPAVLYWIIAATLFGGDTTGTLSGPQLIPWVLAATAGLTISKEMRGLWGVLAFVLVLLLTFYYFQRTIGQLFAQTFYGLGYAFGYWQELFRQLGSVFVN